MDGFVVDEVQIGHPLVLCPLFFVNLQQLVLIGGALLSGFDTSSMSSMYHNRLDIIGILTIYSGYFYIREYCSGKVLDLYLTWTWTLSSKKD